MNKLKFVVHLGTLTRNYFWNCYPIRGGKKVATMGESHKSWRYTCKRAWIMAAGRPCFIEVEPAKKLVPFRVEGNRIMFNNVIEEKAVKLAWQTRSA